ncbi:unnamed protein product, partial [Rotaria sp. Silwood1]
MMKFFLDMNNSIDSPIINQTQFPSLTRICINEISIRNDSYIISMYIKNIEQSEIDIKVRKKESADQWKSSFNVT